MEEFSLPRIFIPLGDLVSFAAISSASKITFYSRVKGVSLGLVRVLWIFLADLELVHVCLSATSTTQHTMKYVFRYSDIAGSA